MEITDLEPLVIEIERAARSKRPLLVALDGRSGTGKSTLSGALAERLPAIVIVQDDFYTGGTLADWATRSAREKADRVIDWKRLRIEVLEPLLSDRVARWRSFNWQTLDGLSDHELVANPSPVIILDGAYSSRPELADLIDLSILMQLDDATRRERIRHRECADFVKEWHPVWDEAEDYYFTHVRPADAFDIIFSPAQ